MKRVVLTSVLLLGFYGSAFGLNMPEIGRNLMTAPAVAEDAVVASYNFEGIIEMSNCSGSIVRFDDSKESDHAMMLTNGHCVKLINPGEVLVNQAASRTFTVLSSTAARLGKVTAQRLLYATMTKTDIGLYELKETYQEISTKYNTNALVLARSVPEVGMDIEVISGYWKRGYSCSIEQFVYQLKEDKWTMQNSIRYSRPGCDTVGGTSGSPVIAAGTRTVIAINNTGNESGNECTMNNPCEVDENGNVTYEKGYSYGQETYWLYTCRNSQGKIDLNLKGCQLPK